MCCRHLRPTDKLRATLPRISEESCSELVSLRLRSASESSLESLSDCAVNSDSESDIEMEVRGDTFLTMSQVAGNHVHGILAQRRTIKRLFFTRHIILV